MRRRGGFDGSNGMVMGVDGSGGCWCLVVCGGANGGIGRGKDAAMRGVVVCGGFVDFAFL